MSEIVKRVDKPTLSLALLGFAAFFRSNAYDPPDARAWAKLFMETWHKIGRPEPSEEWMFIWFANAMMAMHDHMRPDLAPVILPDGSALVAASLPHPQEPAP